MRNAIINLGVALLLAVPTLAQNLSMDLEGPLQGTSVSAASGQVEIVTNGGHQYIKLSETFQVVSQAESEIRHVDGQTGEVTFVARLISRRGYQVYEVPENLVIDPADKLVIYSPMHADDLATVELEEE